MGSIPIYHPKGWKYWFDSNISKYKESKIKSNDGAMICLVVNEVHIRYRSDGPDANY